MRPPAAQRELIQGLGADSGRIRWFSPVEQRELHLFRIDVAIELDPLVVTILVRVSNDVGQRLVDRQSNSTTFLIRQTVDHAQLAYRSADERQEARMARHTKSQMEVHWFRQILPPIRTPDAAKINRNQPASGRAAN